MSARVLEESKRTARKAHRCSGCNAEIAPGDTYRVTNAMFDGQFYRFKWCGVCRKDVDGEYRRPSGMGAVMEVDGVQHPDAKWGLVCGAYRVGLWDGTWSDVVPTPEIPEALDVDGRAAIKGHPPMELAQLALYHHAGRVEVPEQRAERAWVMAMWPEEYLQRVDQQAHQTAVEALEADDGARRWYVMCGPDAPGALPITLDRGRWPQEAAQERQI